MSASCPDLIRAACNVGTIEPSLGDSAVFIPHVLPLHRKEMEMNLLRALEALNEVALEYGYIITADRHVVIKEVDPSFAQDILRRPLQTPISITRHTALDVRENVLGKAEA